MLVSAFLCPNFKIEEREVWELTIDSSPWQELVGAGASLRKSPNARCLETFAKEVEGEKRQERPKHQQGKVGDNESTQG